MFFKQIRKWREESLRLGEEETQRLKEKQRLFSSVVENLIKLTGEGKINWQRSDRSYWVYVVEVEGVKISTNSYKLYIGSWDYVYLKKSKPATQLFKLVENYVESIDEKRRKAWAEKELEGVKAIAALK